MMRLLRWLLLMIILLVASVAGGVAWLLFTQGGRDFLVVRVNRYTATLATPVVVGKLEGNVLHDVRLSGVTVADAGGVWLTIDGVRLVWHPLALLDKMPPFEQLDVNAVRVARLPVAASETEVVSEKSAVNPLDYLVYVPRTLQLHDVLVEAPVTGMRHRLRAEITSRGVVQAVSVSTLEGPVTAASGTVTVKALNDVAVDLSLQEAAKGLLGGLLKLPETATIEGRADGAMRQGEVTVDVVDIRLGQSRVSGRGEGVMDGSRLQGVADVAVENLAEWQKLSGQDLHGAVHGTAQVSGSLQALGFAVNVSRSDVAVNSTRVANATLAISGTVNAMAKDTPFTVSMDMRGRLSGVGKGVYPLGIVAEASGTQAALGVSSSTVMVRPGERAQVRVGGAVVVSPLTVNGVVNALWVQGKNRFAGQGAVQLDPMQAVVNGLRVTGPGVEVSGSGRVDFSTMLVEGAALVNVPDFAPLGALAGVQIKGGMQGQATARVVRGAQVADATVGKFEMEYPPYKALLKQPARLVWDGVNGSLSPFTLEVAGGTVTAQGRMSAQTVNASLSVQNIDVEQVADTDVVQGRVNMQAQISGRPAAPVVVASGGLVGTTGSYPLDIKLKGDWRGGRLVMNAAGSSKAASATADVTVGGKLSLMPFEMGIGTTSTLRGNVVANVPLEMFNTFLWASRQQVGGSLSGSGSVGGTVGTPLVNGRFVLKDGSYNQSTSGLCLQHVGAEISGSADRITVSNVTARDDEKGSLSGQAQLGLAGTQPLSAEVKLANLKMFCGGLISGNVDGEVAAQGTLMDHTIRGALTLGPLQVQIPGSNGDADIPRVETIRVKAGTPAKAGPGMVTRLAVSVNAPQKIYVRGRGLDAEFGGKVDVAGTADAPLLTGGLTALRGRFTLLDRTLQLADSSVRFEGPIPPSPYLAVKATTTAQGTAITLNIDGTATKPTLTLTSDPSVPQDEALALLLFGRKLENISAFEALKLAQATRVLAGLDGGGPGILDKARETLGVDTLDIGSSDNGDTTVTTGKYLTDKIYLSVQQGTEPEDREVKTEIELTPSVSGNTTIDGEGNQSFGLEWKRDY